MAHNFKTTTPAIQTRNTGFCKGLRFRATQSFYSNGFTSEEKTSFKLLKRQSCTGCTQCTFRWDYIKEILSDCDCLPIRDNAPVDTTKDYGVELCDDCIEFHPLGERIYK